MRKSIRFGNPMGKHAVIHGPSVMPQLMVCSVYQYGQYHRVNQYCNLPKMLTGGTRSWPRQKKETADAS